MFWYLPPFDGGTGCIAEQNILIYTLWNLKGVKCPWRSVWQLWMC